MEIILKHNLQPKKFKWLWMKYVVDTNLEKHCTACIKGKYGKKLSGHNQNLENENILILDEQKNYDAIYICGVSKEGYSVKKNYAHNLHAVLIPKEGAKDTFKFENWILECENAIFDIIPSIETLPEEYKNLPNEYVTCRIFRWAIKYSLTSDLANYEYPLNNTDDHLIDLYNLVDKSNSLFLSFWSDGAAHSNGTIFPIYNEYELIKVKEYASIAYREEICQFQIIDFYEYLQDYNFDVDYLLEKYEKHLKIKKLLVDIQDNDYQLSKISYQKYRTQLIKMFIDGSLDFGCDDDCYSYATKYQEVCDDISNFDNYEVFSTDFYYIDNRYNSCTDGECSFYINAIKSDKNKIFKDENRIFKKENDGKLNICLNTTSSIYLSCFNGVIYYCNLDDFSKIYSIKTNGTEEGLFYNCSAAFIQAHDNWVYFCNRSDKRKVYRVNTERTILECLSNDKIIDTFSYHNPELHLLLQDDWIYYQNDNQVIWKLNIATKEKQDITQVFENLYREKLGVDCQVKLGSFQS